MIWFYHNVFLELFFSLSVRFCCGVFFAKSQKWRLGELTASFTLVSQSSIRILIHFLVPITRKKQHSPRYAELHKRDPSRTRGLVTTINTITEKRQARATGKQRRATILQTLRTRPKMIKAVKCKIIFTYLPIRGISHHLDTPCAKALYYCNTDLSKQTLFCDCDKKQLQRKSLIEKPHAMTHNKIQPHALTVAERHAAALIDR